jgi:hypothetical protein
VKAIYKWLDEDEKDFFDGDAFFKGNLKDTLSELAV